MLDLLIILVAVVGVLILISVLAPIRIRISATPEKSSTEVRYLFLRVTRDLATGFQTVAIGPWVVQSGIPAAAPAKPKKPKKEEEPVKPASERARLAWDFRLVLRRTLLVIVRFVGRLLRSVHLQSADVAIEMGLGDPARTGMALGVFHAARGSMLTLFPKLTMTIEPDFYQSRFAIETDIRLRIIPIEPLYYLNAALGTLPWRGLWKFRKAWTS